MLLRCLDVGLCQKKAGLELILEILMLVNIQNCEQELHKPQKRESQLLLVPWVFIDLHTEIYRCLGQEIHKLASYQKHEDQSMQGFRVLPLKVHVWGAH